MAYHIGLNRQMWFLEKTELSDHLPETAVPGASGIPDAGKGFVKEGRATRCYKMVVYSRVLKMKVS